MGFFQKLIEWFKNLFIIKAPKQEPPRKSPSEPNQKLLWVPFAQRVMPMKSRGKYEKGYPVGAVVHFSAGSSAKSTLDWGRENGLMFFMIGKDGTIYQSNPLNEWGYHAGESRFPGLGQSLSSKLVGIEVDCAGRLEPEKGKFKSWFGRIVEPEATRTTTGNFVWPQVAGTYEKFTEAQEQSLKTLLLWLKKNNPNVFNLEWVLGHDEISPGRKNDPGGALSYPMPTFRRTLIELSNTLLK